MSQQNSEDITEIRTVFPTLTYHIIDIHDRKIVNIKFINPDNFKQ